MLGLSLYLIIAGDAFVVSRKIMEMSLKPYNRWYYYLLIILLSFGINTAAEDIIKKELLGIKAYQIPSGAMIPTIMIGDRIIVYLKKYKNETPRRVILLSSSILKTHREIL